MSFEEFFNTYCGNSNTDFNGFGCEDIPNGFQDLDPNMFITLATLVANISARDLPFNLQYTIGNWLQVVGQAMVAYNAQQQYFQNGPGLYYDIRNKNIGNDSCKSSSESTVKNDCNYQHDLAELKEHIKILYEEISRLKKEND